MGRNREAQVRRIVVVLSSLILTACQTAAPVAGVTDEQAFQMARTKPMANLKDPDSAKVDPVFVRKLGGLPGMKYDVICGRVNGKNSFGAYTGMQPFVYNLEVGEISTDASAVAILCS